MTASEAEALAALGAAMLAVEERIVAAVGVPGVEPCAPCGGVSQLDLEEGLLEARRRELEELASPQRVRSAQRDADDGDRDFLAHLRAVTEPGEFEVWAAESAVPVARFSAGGLVSAAREMERGFSRPAARFSPGGIVSALSDMGTSLAPVIEAAAMRVSSQPERFCSECEDERDRDAGCVVCAAIRRFGAPAGRPARTPFYRVVGRVMGLTR